MDDGLKVKNIINDIEKDYYKPMSARQIIFSIFLIISGMIIGVGYVSLWIFLYEYAHIPWWICLITGLGIVIYPQIIMDRKRKCNTCGSINMKVIDSFHDAGYHVADVLKCGKCNNIQKG